MYKDDLYYKSQEMLSGMMNEAEEKRKGEVSNFRESWKLNEDMLSFVEDLNAIMKKIDRLQTQSEGRKYKNQLNKAKIELQKVKTAMNPNGKNESLDESSNSKKSIKKGYYVIMHKGTDRSVVGDAMDKSTALKMYKNQGKGDTPYFGLNQDHSMVYYNGEDFRHVHHKTLEPASKYMNDPFGKLFK